MYGKDADVFVPERWLESEDRSRQWDKLDVTFGSGYCTCLGKNVAIVEINKIVVEVSEISIPCVLRKLLKRWGSCLGISRC